ncbi:MAG: hypothetical protein AAGA30_13965 [Planctomycetota bacterium]
MSIATNQINATDFSREEILAMIVDCLLESASALDLATRNFKWSETRRKFQTRCQFFDTEFGDLARETDEFTRTVIAICFDTPTALSNSSETATNRTQQLLIVHQKCVELATIALDTARTFNDNVLSELLQNRVETSSHFVSALGWAAGTTHDTTTP